MAINPGYAGAEEALSTTIVQRGQWRGIENAPATITFAAHALFKNKHTGFGMLLSNDKIGVHRDLTALANYAFHLKTGKSSFLSMGIQAGLHHKRSDYSSLIDPLLQDPKISEATLTNTFFDVGAGIYFRSERWHAGLSAPQILPENIVVNDTASFRFSRTNFFAFLKHRISITESIDLEPAGLLKYFYGTPLSFDLTLNTIFYQALTFGISYRKGESVDFLLRGQITPQLAFGYSYDYPVGDIQQLSNGSHELMVHYVFRYVQKNTVSPR